MMNKETKRVELNMTKKGTESDLAFLNIKKGTACRSFL